MTFASNSAISARRKVVATYWGAATTKRDGRSRDSRRHDGGGSSRVHSRSHSHSRPRRRSRSPDRSRHCHRWFYESAPFFIFTSRRYLRLCDIYASAIFTSLQYLRLSAISTPVCDTDIYLPPKRIFLFVKSCDITLLYNFILVRLWYNVSTLNDIGDEVFPPIFPYRAFLYRTFTFCL